MNIFEATSILNEDPSQVIFRNKYPDCMIVIQPECTERSNHLSIEALETIFGAKSQVNVGPQLFVVDSSRHVEPFIPTTEDILAVDYMIYK